MLEFAIVSQLFVLANRLHLFEHPPQQVHRPRVDLFQYGGGLAGAQLHWLFAAVLLRLRLVVMVLLDQGSRVKLQLLLHDLDQLARPEEVVQHHGCQLAYQHSHEAEEAVADGDYLVAKQRLIELELLVGGEEPYLGHDQKLEDEGLADLTDQTGLVLEHALRDLAEEVGFLAQDGPVLLAQAD